jgi:hypothetical protein
MAPCAIAAGHPTRKVIHEISIARDAIGPAMQSGFSKAPGGRPQASRLVLTHTIIPAKAGIHLLSCLPGCTHAATGFPLSRE